MGACAFSEDVVLAAEEISPNPVGQSIQEQDQSFPVFPLEISTVSPPEPFDFLVEEVFLASVGEPARPEEELLIPIDTIIVEGSTIFTPEDFASILDRLQGRTVSFSELQKAVEAITQLYLDRGHLTSRAILANQPLDGEIVIQVYEGKLTDIEITGLDRLSEHYIRDRINLGAEQPLQVNDLEDQIRLLVADPLFADFQANLQAADIPGESTLAIAVEEAPNFFGTAFVDNSSPASLGSVRTGLRLGYRNLTHVGDTLSGTYTRSTTGGSHIYDFSYSRPVNPMNGTIDLRFVLDRNRVTLSPFDSLNIEGASELYDIHFRQPLVRSPREEFALTFGFRHKNGQTFLFDGTGTPFSIGADANGVTRTAVLYFTQEYLKRDRSGTWNFRSQFNLGTGWLDSTINSDPVPDGRFFSWLGQVSRLQQLGDKHLLVIEADLQLTPDNLLASETFSFGGFQTLRGYREGARSGDNGWRISIEDRITLVRDQPSVKVFQIAPFLDMGTVWNNPSNPRVIVNEHFLMGVGMGLIWSPMDDMVLRLDATLPIIHIEDRGTDAQDDGFYFSFSYSF